jgi:hypothetical protein
LLQIPPWTLQLPNLVGVSGIWYAKTVMEGERRKFFVIERFVQETLHTVQLLFLETVAGLGYVGLSYY